MITRIHKVDSQRIAQIHINSLSQDFLPSLGINFLISLYQGIIGEKSLFGFADRRQGNIAGFVIGTTEMPIFFRRAILSNFMSLAFCLLLAIIKKPSILKNIMQTLLYTNKDIGPDAELIVIAVSENYRGKGIGKKLVLALEKEMKRRKIKEYKLTVTKRNKQANQFYKSLEFHKLGEFNLYNKDWNVLVKALK